MATFYPYIVAGRERVKFRTMTKKGYKKKSNNFHKTAINEVRLR